MKPTKFNSTISTWSLKTLMFLICSFVFCSNINSQREIRLFSEPNLEDEVWYYDLGYHGIEVRATNLAARVYSIEIKPGYKATFYTEKDFKGDSFTLYAGKYGKLFDKSCSLSSAFSLGTYNSIPIGSIKLARVGESTPVIQLKFKNGLIQRLGPGTFTKEADFIKHLDDRACSERYNNLTEASVRISNSELKEIVVPRGLKVTISVNTGGLPWPDGWNKTVTLKNTTNREHQTFDYTGAYQVPFATTIEVETDERYYKITKIDLEELSSIEGPSAITNTKVYNPQGSGTSEAGTGSTFFWENSITHSLSSESSRQLTVGSSITVGAEVSGGIGVVEASVSTSATVSVEATIAQSLSRGKEETKTSSIALQSNCTYKAPAKTSFTLNYVVNQKEVEYKVTTTLISTDKDGTPLPNSSPFEVTSTLKTNKAIGIECRIKDL